jgi:hypothetical protein
MAAGDNYLMRTGLAFLDAPAAVDAILLSERYGLLPNESFRVVAPGALKRASFEKNSGPDARTVACTEAFDAEDDPGRQISTGHLPWLYAFCWYRYQLSTPRTNRCENWQGYSSIADESVNDELPHFR